VLPPAAPYPGAPREVSPAERVIERAVPSPTAPSSPPVTRHERVERTLERILERAPVERVIVPRPPQPESRPPSASERTSAAPEPAPAPAAVPEPRTRPIEPARPRPAERMVTERAEPLPTRAIIHPRLEPVLPLEPALTEPSAPVVHVHIDRIVVHGEPPERAPVRAPVQPPRGGELLARYLAGRSGKSAP
jgi:hypothetical protein